MGNNLRGRTHAELGSHTTIDVTREKPEREDGGGYSQGWTVSYTAYDESSCTLYLEKTVNKRDRVSEVFLQLEDDMCSGGGIRFWIERAQRNFLDVDYKCDKSFPDKMVSKTTDNSSRTVKIFYYRRGSKRGLVLVEWKKKSKYDEYPYRAAVAHCYAFSTTPTNSSRIDVGLWMLVNIRASNNNLDFVVGGPNRLPSSELYQMFELVSGSGTWKPPRYAETQRQRSDFSEQSETDSEDDSEDNETESDGCETESEDKETENEDSETESDGSETESEDRCTRGNVLSNKDINGNGNGNRIKGNQKFQRSINFIFLSHKHKHA